MPKGFTLPFDVPVFESNECGGIERVVVPGSFVPQEACAFERSARLLRSYLVVLMHIIQRWGENQIWLQVGVCLNHGIEDCLSITVEVANLEVKCQGA